MATFTHRKWNIKYPKYKYEEVKGSEGLASRVGAALSSQ